MFKKDQAIIQDFASESAENVAIVAKFVQLTIRRQFYMVKGIMTGETDTGLMSRTYKGIEWSRDNSDRLYAACYSPGLTHSERLLLISACPGLGLPKSGFLLQLCTGKTGCLDSHNIKCFGLHAKDFSLSGLCPSTAAERAELYVRTCERLGGSEFLWDFWCGHVAELYPDFFADAEAVSKEHVNAIIN